MRTHCRYHYGMKITIDKAGRVVVPKAVREQYNLSPGMELQLEAAEGGILLRTPDTGPSLTEEQCT